MGTDICNPINGNCTNTEGSFNCSCNIGYRGDGINCSSKLLSFFMDILKCKKRYRVMHSAQVTLLFQILMNAEKAQMTATIMQHAWTHVVVSYACAI